MKKRIITELIPMEIVKEETVEVRLSQPGAKDSRFEPLENGKYLFLLSKLNSNEKLVDKLGHLFVERVKNDATYLL